MFKRRKMGKLKMFKKSVKALSKNLKYFILKYDLDKAGIKIARVLAVVSILFWIGAGVFKSNLVLDTLNYHGILGMGLLMVAWFGITFCCVFWPVMIFCIVARVASGVHLLEDDETEELEEKAC